MKVINVAALKGLDLEKLIERLLFIENIKQGEVDLQSGKGVRIDIEDL